MEDLLNSMKSDDSKKSNREALMEELVKLECRIDELESKYGTAFRQQTRKLSVLSNDKPLQDSK